VTPFHVITGFLGSGKTTLLGSLLREPRGERIAVLVNEVGELPVDRHLLEELDDGVWALSSGCVCCALRDDLHAAVARVLAREPTRVVLETTGVADPAPILHALSTDPRLSRLVRAGGVCAVLDVQRAETLLSSEPEARRQLEFADRVVLTKADLAPQRLDSVRALVAEAAPGCAVAEGAVDARWFFDAPPLARMRDRETARNWLHPPSGPDVTTHAFTWDRPVDPEALQLWLRLVTQLDGPRLLRVKAIAVDDGGDAWVLQSAGAAVSPARRLGARPGVRGLQAVLIERELPDPGRLLDSLRLAAEGR